MNALVIDAPGRVSFREIPDPIPGEGEVLLRICHVGFCGSDLSTFRGVNPMVSYPRIPGHEVGAVVETVAGGVPESIQPGMRVTISPYTACGRCPSCRQGRTNCCRDNQTLGVQRDGVLASHLAVPWEKVFAFEGLSTRELALVEPMSVGFHAVGRGRVGESDVVAVFGCGAIGLGVVAGAAFSGARAVIAVDVDDRKLSVAKKAGATHAVNSARVNLREALQEITAGDGPNAVVEAVGLPQTYRAAIEEVAFAGRVVYIGYAKAPVEYETKLFVQKELDVLGSRNAMPEDFRRAAQALQEKRFPVDDVITRTVSLEEAGEALRAWSESPQDFTKIQVVLSDKNKP